MPLFVNLFVIVSNLLLVTSYVIACNWCDIACKLCDIACKLYAMLVIHVIGCNVVIYMSLLVIYVIACNFIFQVITKSVKPSLLQFGTVFQPSVMS